MMRMAAYAALSGRGHGGLSSDGFFLAVHNARVGSGAAEPRLDEPHPVIQHSCLPAEPASGSPREVIVVRLQQTAKTLCVAGEVAVVYVPALIHDREPRGSRLVVPLAARIGPVASS
jgi:hypothetical protein